MEVRCLSLPLPIAGVSVPKWLDSQAVRQAGILGSVWVRNGHCVQRCSQGGNLAVFSSSGNDTFPHTQFSLERPIDFLFLICQQGVWHTDSSPT